MSVNFVCLNYLKPLIMTKKLAFLFVSFLLFSVSSEALGKRKIDFGCSDEGLIVCSVNNGRFKIVGENEVLKFVIWCHRLASHMRRHHLLPWEGVEQGAIFATSAAQSSAFCHSLCLFLLKK